MSIGPICFRPFDKRLNITFARYVRHYRQSTDLFGNGDQRIFLEVGNSNAGRAFRLELTCHCAADAACRASNHRNLIFDFHYFPNLTMTF